MCLNLASKSKKQPKPRIATENIVCYKTMHRTNYGLQSVFKRFNYQLKEKYGPLEFDIRHGGFGWSLLAGFHSFRTLARAQRSADNTNRVIVKCVIPKGSKYYIGNGRSEYASNRLIIKEIVSLKLKD
jgi:hypothetical protein